MQLCSSGHGKILLRLLSFFQVGHTGKYEAAIKGVEATDKGIGIIYEACKKAGYTLFVTADHGNAEVNYHSRCRQIAYQILENDQFRDWRAAYCPHHQSRY